MIGTPDSLALVGRPRAVSVAGAGRAVAVAFAERTADGSSTRMMVARSLDGGGTWFPARPITPMRLGTLAMNPTPFVEPDGGVTLVWREIAGGRVKSVWATPIPRGAQEAPAAPLQEAPAAPLTELDASKAQGDGTHEGASHPAIRLGAGAETAPRGAGPVPTIVFGQAEATPPSRASAIGSSRQALTPRQVTLSVWRLRAPDGWHPVAELTRVASPLGYNVWGGVVRGVETTLLAAVTPAGQLELVSVKHAAADRAQPSGQQAPSTPAIHSIAARPAAPEPVWRGTGDDRLLAGWSEHRPGGAGLGTSRVWLTRSDDGVSWSSPAQVAASQNAPAPLARFAADRGLIVAVWCGRDSDEPANGSANDSIRIWLASSRDGGTSFGEPMPIRQSGARRKRLSPDVAVLGQRVAVVWQETVEDAATNEIHGVISLDGGRSWSTGDTRLDDSGGLRDAWLPSIWLPADAAGLATWESRALRASVYRSVADVEKPLPASVLVRRLE